MTACLCFGCRPSLHGGSANPAPQLYLLSVRIAIHGGHLCPAAASSPAIGRCTRPLPIRASSSPRSAQWSPTPATATSSSHLLLLRSPPRLMPPSPPT